MLQGLLSETVPASTTQLTTLSTAKADLGLGDDTSQDDNLKSLIDRASSVIATHCGKRVFGLRTLSEMFRFDRNMVTSQTINDYPDRSRAARRPPALMTHYPIVTLTSVTADGATLADGADYEADTGAGMVWRLYGNLRTWWTSQVVTLVYTSGWNLPTDANRNMPADLEDHCLTLVRSAYYGQGRNPNIAMDLVEGVGRTQYWDRSISSMVVDDSMSDALSQYVLRVW